MPGSQRGCNLPSELGDDKVGPGWHSGSGCGEHPGPSHQRLPGRGFLQPFPSAHLGQSGFYPRVLEIKRGTVRFGHGLRRGRCRAAQLGPGAHVKSSWVLCPQEQGKGVLMAPRSQHSDPGGTTGGQAAWLWGISGESFSLLPRAAVQTQHPNYARGDAAPNYTSRRCAGPRPWALGCRVEQDGMRGA